MNDGLINVREAAGYLGLAQITIYKYVSAKQIPYVKLGRRLLFDPCRLKAWVEEKTVSPISA